MSTVRYAIGLGCDRGTPQATLQQAIDEALAGIGTQLAQVAAAASIDLKADEPGLLALAAAHGWALRFYSAAQLAEVPVPHPSETVRRHTGTPNQCYSTRTLRIGPLRALSVAAFLSC